MANNTIILKDGYARTKLQELIEDFMIEEIPVAEVMIERGRNPLNTYRSLRVAINRLNYHITVRVKSIGDHVYLINQPLLEQYRKGCVDVE